MEKVWSDWIEWTGGECPIPDAKAGEYQVAWMRDATYAIQWSERVCASRLFGWDCGVTAYRELIAPPARLEDTSRQDAIDYAADCAKVENLLRVSAWTNRLGGWNAEV